MQHTTVFLYHTVFLYQLSQASNCCLFMINISLVSKNVRHNEEIQTRPMIWKIPFNGSPEDLANTRLLLLYMYVCYLGKLLSPERRSMNSKRECSSVYLLFEQEVLWDVKSNIFMRCRFQNQMQYSMFFFSIYTALLYKAISF